MKPTARRSRVAANRQSQARFQPQHPIPIQQDFQRDTRRPPQSRSQAEPHRRGFQYGHRSKVPKGKKNGKTWYSCMVEYKTMAPRSGQMRIPLTTTTPMLIRGLVSYRRTPPDLFTRFLRFRAWKILRCLQLFQLFPSDRGPFLYHHSLT